MPSDFPYGGQAVLNGVMIRGKSGMAIACRLRDNTIRTHFQPITPLSTRSRILRLPFLRGTPALFDALTFGLRALIWSADTALEDEGHKPTNPAVWWLTIAASLAIGIGILVVLPSLVVPKIGHAPSHSGPASGWWPAFISNFLEGAIRMAFFLIYLLVIMRMKEIQRVFQYHGAEHKVINAFEHHPAASGQQHSRIHRRCGTNFIAAVIVVGIIVHLLFGWPAWHWRILIRLLAIPVVAGISYEFLRAAGRHPDSRLYSLLVAPGLLIQRLTTREPTADQVEVARAALDAVLAADKSAQGEAAIA